MDGPLLGFDVYRIDEPDQTPLPLKEDYFQAHRRPTQAQVHLFQREVTARFQLQPGTYTVIPSTLEPDQEGEFMLRIFSEKGSPVP